MGVLETISDFCEKFQTTYTAVKIDLQIDISEQDVPEYLKTPLFRIFQEALNNAARHSKASRINVGIRKATDKIELAIEDNGAGFELKDKLSANAKGLGLFSMKERTELSGGSMEFRSSPGEGTTVRATWLHGEAQQQWGEL
jgi:signal transduction histidine kinase